MTLNEKEEYDLRIKNMQSKIDYLREQRENLTTYAKKYVPLPWERVLEIGVECANDSSRLPYEVKIARAIEAAHGIK